MSKSIHNSYYNVMKEKEYLTGMVTGFITHFETGSILYALFIAFITGFFAYGGQELFKFIVKKVKARKFK